VILVDPEWKRVIDSANHSYFQEIVRDFAARTKSAPHSLFEQALEINLGPLVTVDAGVFDLEEPRLSNIVRRFIPAFD
jgi:hypothetical protein